MKKLFFYCIVFVAITGITFLILRTVYLNRPSIKAAVVSPFPTSVSPSAPVPAQFFSPARVHIPKIGVKATVEYVGLDKKGNMDIPKQDMNVAWYQLGYKPGERGNSVIAGHLDSPTGPAVFINLNQLQAGDTIEVTDTQGKTFQFEVTKTATYPFDQFPIEQVFGSSNEPRLNLITCDGSFDRATKNYSKRFVVYSRLVS